MESKRLSAQLLSPLSISSERQSQFSACLDYIPGSTMRGALAQRYLDVYGQDGLFKEIFLNENCRFSDLLPSRENEALSRYLPFTACSCKRNPGFAGHGVGDLLWLRASQHLLDEIRATADIPRNLDDPVCPSGTCRQDIKTINGYWNAQVDAPTDINVLRTETLHTGIDRTTGTVAESILYSIESVEPHFSDGTPIWFNGYLNLSASAWPRMKELLAPASSFFLGHGRTRGHGEVQLKLGVANAEPDSERWVEWNAACHQFIQRAIGLKARGFFFSVGLLSDAIIVDPYLRYMAALDLQWPGLHHVCSVMKRGVAIGWNQAHHLPKEDEITISRGSVFLYRFDGELYEIKEKLDYLETMGIGLRRNEGFGRILISDPLHHQLCAYMEED